MNSQKALSMFLSLAFVGAFAQAVCAAPSQQHALSFHGRLVNAGCDARLQTADVRPVEPKSLKVGPRLDMVLAAHNDACKGAVVPVSTAYVEQASSFTGQRDAIVTLTYQ